MQHDPHDEQDHTQRCLWGSRTRLSVLIWTSIGRCNLTEKVLTLLVDILDMRDVLVTIDVVNDSRVLLINLMHHSSLSRWGGQGARLDALHPPSADAGKMRPCRARFEVAKNLFLT